MSTELKDLWPEYVEVTEVLTPEQILNYQASQLSQRTKGTLTAKVITEKGTDTAVKTSESITAVTHHFEIVVPALDNYRFRLFSVSHKRDQVYPAMMGGEIASSQEGFMKLLEKTFSDDNTKSVIQSLLAQVHIRLRGNN